MNQDLMQLIHNKQPPALLWKNINVRLSFANLGNRGQVLRLQWLWGRTQWIGTAGWWDRDSPIACAACASPASGITSHRCDLFSCLAHCPAWQALRTIMLSWWEPHTPLVTAWFQQAARSEQRDFARSLIPTTLAQFLSQTLSPQQLAGLVRNRDNRWASGTRQLRQEYAPNLQPCPPQNNHPHPDPLQSPNDLLPD